MTFSQGGKKVGYKIFLFFLLGFLFGGFWTFLLIQKEIITIGFSQSRNENVQNAKNNIEDNKETEIFFSPKVKKIYSLIKSNFYGFDTKPMNEIQDGIIHSMITSLGDKHSEFFNEIETKEFNSELSGDFDGIGVVISDNPKGIRVEKILKDSPAEKGKLEIGDIITHVNSIGIQGKTTKEVVQEIRGPKGSNVELVFLRNGEEKKVSLTRDSVNVPSVEGKVLENSDIGYIYIGTFGNHTPDEFRKTIEDLKLQGARAFILDFRFNSGGYLKSAVDMLSQFLGPGTNVVEVRENDPTKNETLYTSIFSRADTKIPVIVLVNEFSASASEIFAGALQDYGRAVILGTKTYGKGSVQEMFDLGDGTMMKMTIARWYTPKGNNIDEKGINPDVVVNIEKDDYKKPFDRQLETAKKGMQQFLENPTSFEEFIKNLKNITF